MMEPERVVIWIVEKEWQFLVIERAKKEWDLLWAFPWWKLKESDQTQEIWLSREVEEESTVVCEPYKYLWERSVANNTIIISYRLCKYLSWTPTVTRPHEIKSAKWSTPDELFTLFTTDIYAPVKEYIISSTISVD